MITQARNPELVKLMAEITRYQQTHGMADTAFGMWAVGDPNLIREIKKGRDLRWQTIAAIRSKMAEDSAA